MTRHPYEIFIDPQFQDIYRQHPLVLVDVGARGGLKPNWAAARPYLHVLGFEPDKGEYGRLAGEAQTSDSSTTWFDVALHNRSGPIRLHVARDRGLTSIFEPDRTFLDRFPQADRFDTVDVQQVDADTLDNLLHARKVNDIDFVKADTQGSELYVLEGAAHAIARSVIGVEVEVEFTPIYRGQPLFADVDHFLRNLGFLLFDLRPCYWKRSSSRAIGGPKGQIIWADALYLRSLPSLRTMIGHLDPDLQKSKLLRALSISTLYGYFDYAIEMLRDAGGFLAADERALIERRLREGGGRNPSTTFPGRRQLAAMLHRLWRVVRSRDDSWSVSGANLGNFR
jgi:FkbM family methyltransferase